MCDEEHVEQFVEREHCGIKFDLHDFGVACVFFAHLLVGGIFYMAAGEAGFDGFHAFEALEDGFDAPIAAASDDDLLVGGGGGFGGFGVHFFGGVGVEGCSQQCCCEDEKSAVHVVNHSVCE